MNKKALFKGRVYLETGDRKASSKGVVLLETSALAGSPIAGSPQIILIIDNFYRMMS